MHPNIHRRIIYNYKKKKKNNWKQPKYLSTDEIINMYICTMEFYSAIKKE